MKMKMAPSVFVLAMFVLVGSAQAGVCPGTNLIQDPPEFGWTNSGGYQSGTLEIGEATLTIGTDTLTTRAYRQAGGTFSITGPTMRMMPGETYVLTFKNTLPWEVPSPVHNEFKDPNITNIHTHGLHVSGETPADDITRLINGGYCGDYLYEVPSDHMGGTLWYHAHHHGSTYLQVAGGAFGLLIVDDSGDRVPTNVAGMTERLLAIGFLDPTVAGTGGDTLVSGTLSPTWTVNGLVEGNLCTPANEWQHWRVLLADRDARMKTLSVEPTSACEVALLARDGVWRREAIPKDLPTNSVELTGASRADLAVRCSADATIKVNGTTVANIFADDALPANSVVGPYSNGATGTTWLAIRPDYLRDLRDEAQTVPLQIENRSINMGARTINGEKFDKDVPTFSSITPSVQEWQLKGAKNHPFHQHIYHVQMNGTCGAFEDGEYYDTVAGNCLVRFDLDPANSTEPTHVYYGRTIMHCHILAHEDQGAMGWYDGPLSGAGPGTLPGTHQALYQCGDNGGGGEPPQPVVCSQFDAAKFCNAEPTCRWSGKNKECVSSQ
jgi:FtsP/CotA-like multicopper oxidase with cupredoxin domain